MANTKAIDARIAKLEAQLKIAQGNRDGQREIEIGWKLADLYERRS